jgi:hypothetical protein
MSKIIEINVENSVDVGYRTFALGCNARNYGVLAISIKEILDKVYQEFKCSYPVIFWKERPTLHDDGAFEDGQNRGFISFTIKTYPELSDEFWEEIGQQVNVKLPPNCDNGY